MKKIVALILSIALVFLLCACTNGKIPFIDNLFNKTNKNVVGDGSNNASVATTVAANNSAQNVTNNVTVSTTGQQEVAPTPVSLNQPFNVGSSLTITLASAEWTDEIKPTNQSGFYSYYSDKPGEKYFVIKGTLKNLTGKTVEIDDISRCKLTINGQYESTAYMELEGADGTDFYGSAKPLQTLNLIVKASVSDELYNIYKDAEMIMSIVDDPEKYNNFYSEKYSQSKYSITFNK